jgi:hypothetical protein
MFGRGERIEFSYPIENNIASPPLFSRRRIQVVRSRDLVSHPLTPSEFLRRPFVRRSRWLLTGIELDTGEWRNFYLGATREFRAPGTLRIGLYLPDESFPRKIISRGFEDCPAERRKLVKLLWMLADQEPEQADLEIRILADDLRLVA